MQVSQRAYLVVENSPRGIAARLNARQSKADSYALPRYSVAGDPVEVILARSGQGCGVLGVIDGSSPKGVESDADVTWRHDLLRKIGYKR